MKKILLLILALSLTNCGCKEDEEFTPYPGGKTNQEQNTPR